MDFAANGKYLASCGDEDPDPDGMSTTESTSSSSSESNKENSRPTSAEHSPLLPKGLSRRQRKNRKREPKYVTPAEPPKPTKTKVSNQCKSKVAAHHVEPLEEFKKLNISESLFAQMLVNNYVLRSEHMAILGYPARPNKRAIISDKMVYMYKKHHFDINAKEFVPKSDSNDSGQCSGSSSEEESSSSSDDSSPRYRNTPFYGRVCVRCGSWFYTTSNTYITDEACSYHWGKLRTHGHGYGPLEYTCCNGKNGSKGCSEAKVHVWNGPAEPLVNSSYVETEKPKHVSEDGNYGVFALDCEMSYTVTGLEVTKVTLVSMEGKIIYNEYVRPKNEVVDYNTRFSGITADDFKNNRSKTLQQVQRDLKKLINSKTVLIGHALENDLKGLRMIHKTVVDTTFTFPHDKGFPFKRSLKSLVRSCLKRDIQCSEKGHDSYEDARASMELMLYRLRRDFSL
ncbi:putative exonuclease GOR isoform X3 [Cylas formicarius]|nr:putative exonuclease GOR isoform X3 [Cylas formicarius]XP_060521664.1 putative exonuclease GOR isoform X3 [Cylas formicarius]